MTDPAAPLRLRLAGPVEVTHGDLTVDERQLGGAQARLAFAVLVLERARVLPRDELADIVWGGELPSTWESALRTLVSRSRAFVVAAGLAGDETLVGGRDGYQLRLPHGTAVDVEDGERHVTAAEAAAASEDHRRAAREGSLARAALALPFLPGIDNPWADRWRQRLLDLRVRACEAEAAARLAEGDVGNAVLAADEAVNAAPYRESAYRLLMRAHAAAGNRAEALRVHERCRNMLAEELGVNPSPETESVYIGLLGEEPAPAPPETATTGTVTFLFTDIEGSSARWEQDAEAMTHTLARHDQLLADVVTRHGGRIFKHTGDGVCAVFAAASDAIFAAVDAQRGILGESWGSPPLRIRVGVHTGEAEVRGDDYAGIALSRIARLCALASGGQILVSSASRLVVDGRLPSPVGLQYLAEVELRGMAGTEPVYQVTHPDLPVDFPPIHTGHRQGSSLAVEDSALLGRDTELADVLGAVDSTRLVTISGVGGVGKTRLALAVAHRASRSYGERTWWIELGTVGPDAVAFAVANVVGGSRQGVEALAATIAKLEEAPAFLVLDNCEHAAAQVRVVVEAILAACPAVRLVATSRVPLGVAGEEVVRLAPLEAPTDGAAFDDLSANAAVQVFVHRAHAVSRGFSLSASNADAVAEICRRLDGLPLALELAAARVRSMPPAQIAQHLDERFRLLRSTHRDPTGRERRLEDVVRWSYELLAEDERRVFDQLSVFAGSFTVEAAAAVAGLDLLDTSDLLDALVAASMLVVVEDDTFARYAVLETMREFGRAALELTGAAPGALERHRAHYLALAQAAATGIRGADEARWVRVLHADFDNLRALYIRAAAAGDVDSCLQLVVALFDYAFFRMRREVGRWAVDAMGLAGVREHPLYGAAAGVAGYLAWESGAIEAATAFAEAAVAAEGGWAAHDGLATIRLFQGQVGDAITHYAQAVALSDAAGSAFHSALALAQVAFAHVFTADADDGDRAVELAAAAEIAAARSHNPTATATAAWAMGIALFDRDAADALEHLVRSIEIARDVDNRMSVGAAATPAEELRTKLSRRTVDDDLRAALDHIEYWVTAGNTSNFWGTVRRMARDFASLGHHEWAAVALGADAEASSKLPLRDREQARHDAVVTDVRAALGAERFAEYAARGAAMAPGELVDQLRGAVAGLGA